MSYQLIIQLQLPLKPCVQLGSRSSANVNVATDRGWFTDHTPFASQLSDAYGMGQQLLKVLAIGTIDLKLKKGTTPPRQKCPLYPSPQGRSSCARHFV